MNWCIETHDILDSTQTLLKEKATEGTSEGLVIQALEQTAGKGRSGNTWTSPAGNLYMSVLLRPDISLQKAGDLAFVSALAISDALTELSSKPFQLKWPNDVLFEGGKIAGILIESDTTPSPLREEGRGEGGNNLHLNPPHPNPLPQGRGDIVLNWLAIGIGVNLAQAPEGAACLQDICDNPIDLAVLRDSVLSSLEIRYRLWNKKGFAPLREAWLNLAYGLDQPITARLPHETVSGIFKGLDDQGALILETDGETRIIQSATVHFGDDI